MIKIHVNPSPLLKLIIQGRASDVGGLTSMLLVQSVVVVLRNPLAVEVSLPATITDATADEATITCEDLSEVVTRLGVYDFWPLYTTTIDGETIQGAPNKMLAVNKHETL